MTYRTPGVYVEEISVFPPSVAEVETAIPAFIGYTEFAKKDGADMEDPDPIAISSLKEYEEHFGVACVEAADAFSIIINEKHDAADAIIGYELISWGPTDKISPFNLYYSMKLFFDNGGGKCYVVSAGLYSENAVDDDKLISATAKVKSLDEPTLIVIPEGAPLGIAKYIPIAQAAINQCAEMKDRFAILDVPIAAPKKKFEASDITEFRKLSGDADHIRYSASYYPYLKSTITYSTDMGVLELATVKKNGVDDAANVLKGKKLGEIQSTNNSAYHAILSELKGKLKVVLPPSPAMAGIYARVDSSRGVWKAPANVSVQSVSGPSQILTDADQGDLNMDSVGGKSINVIRSFSGRGTIVWGGRTLDGNSNEWRYINVRRFFNMVEESVQKSTVWAVFEPNTKNTWVMVKSMIENYLITKWQQGALAGAKPDDAFYVKVGLGVTMTADDILNGIMNVEIGMAVARPAEFIVLKFSHKMQVS